MHYIIKMLSEQHMDFQTKIRQSDDCCIFIWTSPHLENSRHVETGPEHKSPWFPVPCMTDDEARMLPFPSWVRRKHFITFDILLIISWQTSDMFSALWILYFLIYLTSANNCDNNNWVISLFFILFSVQLLFKLKLGEFMFWGLI